MNLNIISFNLRYRDDADQNSIAERAPRLCRILPRYDADILCFQEVSKTWQPYLEKDYSNDYSIYLQYRNQTANMEGNAILWKKNKFELLRQGCFWLSDTPQVESKGWDELYDCFRICIYTVLKEIQSRKIFVVMNTHLGFGDNGQTKSCKLIYDYSKQISAFPTMVVGDFNFQPVSPAYATMVRSFRDVNSCTGNDLRPTWHGYRPEIIEPAHFDYCFIDEQVSPVRQMMITDTVDGKFPSDHYGIYCTLTL